MRQVVLAHGALGARAAAPRVHEGCRNAEAGDNLLQLTDLRQRDGDFYNGVLFNPEFLIPNHRPSPQTSARIWNDRSRAA